MASSRKISLAAIGAAATFVPTAAIATGTLLCPRLSREGCVRRDRPSHLRRMHLLVRGDVTVGHRYDGLTADQLSCFQGMRSDLRAIRGPSAATAEACDELLDALLSGTSMHWRSTVRAVYRLLAAVHTSPAPSARARLETFIAENYDLLDARS
jgi:hypothetical protein